MNIDLTNKNALVCGSTQGIGLAVAQELASMGACVTLAARNEILLQQTAASLPSPSGQKHDFIVADFSSPESVRAQVTHYLGNGKIFHILVNNTGGPAGGPITEAKSQEFMDAFQQHLVCNHVLVQSLLPGMKSEKYGRIINVISTSVKIPLKGLGVSNTIRAAVANWSKTLSNEVASFGITVNNVLPGATQTSRLSSIIKAKSDKTGKEVTELEKEMLHEIPMGRFASPSEIAAAVAFLASPSASYITGINVPVDGGRTGAL
jgi:3-oxoacyl-[acyl-carrier protein] reductase